jgi:hypothetical protein
VKRVKGLLAEVFPLVELTEALIAIDGATGFSERLLHAANSRSPAMLVYFYAAILAQATNLGPELRHVPRPLPAHHGRLEVHRARLQGQIPRHHSAGGLGAPRSGGAEPANPSAGNKPSADRRR